MARGTIILIALLVLHCLLGSEAAAVPKYAYSLPPEREDSNEQASAPYQGHKVIRINNPSAAVRAIISKGGFDPFGRGKDHIDLHIAPGSKDVDTLTEAAGGKLEIETLVDDLQALVDKDRAENAPSRESDGNGDDSVDLTKDYFADYHKYPEIVEFVRGVCGQAGDICEFTPSIGKSVQGRDLVSVKLGKKAEENTSKPQFFLQGLQHAREWVATTTVQWIFFQLATKYGKDDRITKLLDAVDVVIVPVSNPDGYEYTWTSKRLWRKNRRNNGNGSYGVDLNRNWPYHWGGDSRNPRSETYQGPSAGSEPETQALLSQLDSLPNVIAAIDMHSFSQLLLRPWGDTNTDSPDEPQFAAVTNEMSTIIRAVHGKKYVAQKSIGLYPTTGTADDTVYSLVKTLPGSEKQIHPYSITIELRPEDSWGGGGFILPKDQIVPTGQEIFPAFLRYAENALENPLVIR